MITENLQTVNTKIKDLNFYISTLFYIRTVNMRVKDLSFYISMLVYIYTFTSVNITEKHWYI